MERKKELELMLAAVRVQLGQIEEAEQDEQNKVLLGKCFKYRNNYSCPGPNDYWYLYSRVMSVSDGIKTIQFQRDRDGRIEIFPERTEAHYRFFRDSGHIEITEEEFLEAWEDLFLEVVRVRVQS